MLTIHECIHMNNFFREANKKKQGYTKKCKFLKRLPVKPIACRCTYCEFRITYYDCSEYFDEGESLYPNEDCYCAIGGFKLDTYGTCDEFKRKING